MRVAMLSHSPVGGWRFDGPAVDEPQLVICFMAFSEAASSEVFEQLRARFPDAQLAACTTNGEIYNGEALDGCCVATAIRFDATELRTAFAVVQAGGDGSAAGRRLAQQLAGEGLKGVFVLADAFGFNGQDLVDGMSEALPGGVAVSGGMAGDGGRLGGSTKVGLNCTPRSGGVLAIGFYGPAVSLRHGVAGGWDALGPLRRITRSQGPIVYELDGQPALDVYERLVGQGGGQARVRHPFCIKPREDSEQDVIWEVVAVDREGKGIIFIDDVAQGSWGQIMRGVDEHLVDGAAEATRRAVAGRPGGEALGLVVSCVGRKWLMGQRIGDETEAVQEHATGVPTIGFFSYGEVAPHARTGACTLHHASVAVTVLSEAA